MLGCTKLYLLSQDLKKPLPEELKTESPVKEERKSVENQIEYLQIESITKLKNSKVTIHHLDPSLPSDDEKSLKHLTLEVDNLKLLIKSLQCQWQINCMKVNKRFG